MGHGAAMQTLTTESGEELVVLSRREYDMLLARLGDEDAEDRAAAHLIREARERRSVLPSLPAWLSTAILAGEHPMRAARKRAGLNQVELAARLDLSQGHISDFENGKKSLGPKALARAAEVLGLEVEWLTD